MELWIRSQDREMLKKANVLYVADDGEEGFSIKHYGERFGIYKTKERALEVLDGIQNILKLKDMYKYDRELVLKGWENLDEEQVKIARQQMSVYEMPKE